MSKQVYFDAIYAQAPRLLGLLNRNIGSASYGCFDRNYWHYRVADFSCVTYQEAVLTLALLYNLELGANIYFRNPNILEWINASLNFWSKLQEKNGSFNEWYPHENSFVGTAFSAYAISETLLISGDSSINGSQIFLGALKKAGDWLSLKAENRVLNQVAGAAIALYNIYLLTREHKYLKAAQAKIDFLEKNQDREGWLKEYGGADIGYLSLAIDYLAKYYEKSKDEMAFRILKKAISFLHSFLNPSLTFGGSYSSRNTEYMVPSGFEIMAGHLKESQDIASMVRKSLEEKRTVALDFLDDRYLAYMGYTYLQAFMKAAGETPEYRCEFLPSQISYPNAGIEIVVRDDIHFVYNYKKGGSFKLVFSNKKTVDDWGIILESTSGRKYFSGWLNSEAVFLKSGSFQSEIRTYFQQIRQFRFSPFKLVASRSLQFLLCLNESIGNKVKSALRDIMITRKDKTRISLRRSIYLKEDRVQITDRIEDAKDIRTVILNAKASYIYVPSSCYYQVSDLDSQPLIYNRKDSWKCGIEIVREYNYKGDLLRSECLE